MAPPPPPSSLHTRPRPSSSSLPVLALPLSLLLLLPLSLLLWAPVPSSAFIISLAFKECFIQHVGAGDSITGRFTVLESGYPWSNDPKGIDFWVEAPNNYKMFSVRGKEEEQFQLRSIHDGDYKFCLDNPQHTTATVDFSFHIGHLESTKLEDVAKDEHFDELYNQLWTLEGDVWDIMQTQEHFKARDERRKQTLQSTGRRLLWYQALEACVLIAASGIQLYILRRLFERKAARIGAL